MKSHTKQTIKIFWQHAWRYKWQVVVIILGILLVEGMQTYTPLVYRELFNLLAGPKTDSIYRQGIRLIVIILVLNFARIILWRLHNFTNNFFQPRVMADLTNTCYKYLQKHSSSFFNNNFVGSLVTKVKRYERSFEIISDQIYYDLGRSIIDTTLVISVLIWQYRLLGLTSVGWCIVFLLFSFFYSRYKLPYDIRRAAADTKTTAQLADSMTNNINIKLFTGYERENERFANVTEEQFALRKKSWNLGTWGDLWQSLMMILLEFLGMYWAIIQWMHGNLLVGDIVLIQAYLFRIFDKLWNTGKNMRSIYEALADANEMTEILNTPHEIKDLNGAGELKVKKGLIEFSNTTFQYNKGVEVLTNFNLTIASKEKIALIGPSGGGKSTIVKLLLRFLDINSGSIKIDGQDISTVTQDSLRESIALVPQEPILFHRSLAENIRYAKPLATDAEVIKAARLAHAHEFIESFPEKYNTLVGERGIKLSGGQRQRVAIARAILKNAPILILDEATSSLDSESEMLIKDALKNLMKNKTVIVIAHRLSTIMQMDRIVVLENGQITEQGKHEELLKAKQGTYQKLWEIQAGGFNSGNDKA
ncbi:MAG: ABC transporter ATP-binding protein [Candidatus Doudnabacteria bacterium]|nr:ABC transporter ATP-binding protein [Candidatus Doudnabacteria bacterium]